MFDLEVDVKEKKEIVPRDFKIDFKTGKIVMKNGSPVFVEREEAIKVWVYKVLLVKRGFFDAYSFEYGQDYEDLIGSNLSKGALQSEAKRITEEALYDHLDIFKVDNFYCEVFEDKMSLEFSLDTKYGLTGMEVVL